MYLLTLFGMIILLIALSMVAFDLLLKNIFGRLEYITASLRLRVETPSSAKHFTDELQELEYLTHYLEDGGITLKSDNPAPPSAVASDGAAVEAGKKHEDFLNEIRPKAINSLGYFHRIKAQVPATPNLQLLEKELREMRALIDPATATAQGAKPTPAQPYFNPILDAFKKETALEADDGEKAQEPASAEAEAFIAEITKVESAPMVLSSLSPEIQEKIKKPVIIEDASAIPTAKEIAEEVAEAMKAISALNIRKPKREGHESNNI